MRALMAQMRGMESRLSSDLGVKIDSLKTDLTQQVEAKATETLAAAKTYTDEKIGVVLVHSDAALLKLRAASERALRNGSANVVLLSNYTPNDTEAARKTQIDEVVGAIGKKYRKIDHVKPGGALGQFTRVEFEAEATASAFISKWIAMKKQNTASKPVFARTEQSKELRALHAPLVKAEKAVKAYFRGKAEKHTVKCGNWAKGGELLVDKLPVARLTGHLTVEWVDAEFKAAVSSAMDLDDL